MGTNGVAYHHFLRSGFDIVDVIRNSQFHSPLPQNNGDVMEEFRRNGREVPIDDSSEHWETNFNSLYRPTHGRCTETSHYLHKDLFPMKSATRDMWCAFCRNNGESDRIYRSHQLKDKHGKTVCPILQMYVCPLCKATGPEAHTVKYCPKNSNHFPVTLTNAMKPHKSEVGKTHVKRNRY